MLFLIYAKVPFAVLLSAFISFWRRKNLLVSVRSSTRYSRLVTAREQGQMERFSSSVRRVGSRPLAHHSCAPAFRADAIVLVLR